METRPIPQLIGDANKLRQVMINLVKNALVFTRSGSGGVDVLACYERENNMLTIEVQDTGVGIAPEDFPKLFTRFGKLHRTAKMNSGGIGLGLTLVKAIAALGDGKIEVFSEGVDQGTCFTFSIKMGCIPIHQDVGYFQIHPDVKLTSSSSSLSSSDSEKEQIIEQIEFEKG